MLNIINKGLAVMTSDTISKSEYKLPQASNIKHCIKYEVLHQRYTNADLKVSLYVHLKTIPWKFRILNPNNSQVWSLE